LGKCSSKGRPQGRGGCAVEKDNGGGGLSWRRLIGEDKNDVGTFVDDSCCGRTLHQGGHRKRTN